jgi:ribose transport system permease protein
MGRYAGVLVALVLLCVYLSITQDVFLTWDNLMNIAKANSVVFVLAIGATFVVISAGIDLSAASATAAAGMILGLTVDAGWSIVLALAATVLFGILLGLVNGMLITNRVRSRAPL